MADPRILVVDDDAVSRKLLRLMLARMQRACDEVADGAGALAAFAREPYALVLLDRQLPDLDGLQVLGRLRAMPGGPAARVVLVSGDVADPRACGADGALAKPFTFEELERVVAG